MLPASIRPSLSRGGWAALILLAAASNLPWPAAAQELRVLNCAQVRDVTHIFATERDRGVPEDEQRKVVQQMRGIYGPVAIMAVGLTLSKVYASPDETPDTLAREVFELCERNAP